MTMKQISQLNQTEILTLLAAISDGLGWKQDFNNSLTCWNNITFLYQRINNSITAIIDIYNK